MQSHTDAMAERLMAGRAQMIDEIGRIDKALRALGCQVPAVVLGDPAPVEAPVSRPPRKAELPPLTKRQREIMALADEGMSDVDIAVKLGTTRSNIVQARNKALDRTGRSRERRQLSAEARARMSAAQKHRRVRAELATAESNEAA